MTGCIAYARYARPGRPGDPDAPEIETPEPDHIDTPAPDHIDTPAPDHIDLPGAPVVAPPSAPPEISLERPGSEVPRRLARPPALATLLHEAAALEDGASTLDRRPRSGQPTSHVGSHPPSRSAVRKPR